MAILVSILPILAGLSGLHSLSTVSKLTVEEGGSISIPCFYEYKYTEHVKYLCKGCLWGFCSYEIKSNWDNSTKYSISDDKTNRVVTWTIKNPTKEDTDCYWCVMEINDGGDDGERFEVSVTGKGEAALYVESQEVTGLIGDQITIYCHYKGSGIMQWCRTGDAGPTSCVKNSGWIDGTKVTVGRDTTDVMTVTMSGLMKRSSGWYWCTDEDLQMPVHVTIKDRPPTTTTTTTTRRSTIPSSTSKVVNHTHTSEEPTTEQTGTHSSSSNHLLTVVIPLCLLLVIVMVAVLMWFMVKRHKSADAAEDEQTVTYSTVTHVTKASDQQSNTNGEADVTYSTVSFIAQQNTHRVEDKDENVTYSAVAHRQ